MGTTSDMTSKVLITGGTGFIGRNLNEYLKDFFTVHSPTRDEVDLLKSGDISDYLKEHKFDTVVHCATWDATRTSSKDTGRVLSNNLKMFFNLTRMSDLYGKLIYFGSGAEYNRRQIVSQAKESFLGAYLPEDDYGLSKYVMAKFAEKSQNIYDLVLFGVYGKYEDWRIRFISNMCCYALFDRSLTINQNAVFDYLYIDDLSKITKLFIENDYGSGRYNVCTGNPIELLDLAKIVLKVSKKNLKINVNKSGYANEYSGNNKLLLDTLNNFQFTSYEDGVKYLYEYYQDNKNLIDISQIS